MEKTTSSRLLTLVKISLFAAIYAAITLLFAPISFGSVQFRISEALTVLAVFSPWVTIGLTLGCFISNLIGFFMGQTFVWDLIIGPLASLLAGFLAYQFRKVRIKNLPILSATMPAFSNGLMIGSMISILTTVAPSFTYWASLAITIAAGELVVCYFLGIPLCRFLEKNNLDKSLFDAKSSHLSAVKAISEKNNS